MKRSCDNRTYPRMVRRFFGPESCLGNPSGAVLDNGETVILDIYHKPGSWHNQTTGEWGDVTADNEFLPCH